MNENNLKKWTDTEINYWHVGGARFNPPILKIGERGIVPSVRIGDMPPGGYNAMRKIYNKECVLCQKPFETKRKKTLTCSPSCSSKLAAQYRRKKSLTQWLATGKLDYSSSTMIKVDSIYREHITQEQNNKCLICGIENRWNGQSLVLVLDHIDGDSSNHCRNNLRLICPNCDSQLATYKAKNKNSKRDYRRHTK